MQQRLAVIVFRCVAHFPQLAPREQQADGQVHEKKQNQERFGAPQQLRCVGPQAPGEADTKGADEADHVEGSPRLEPGNGKDAGVEQGEITEQRDMAASAGGREDWRGETAQCSGAGQRQGILGDGQNSREHRHRYQQAERGGGVQQRMQAHRGKHRQVQHANPGALQHQGIVAIALAQPPAQAEQGQCGGRDPGITQLERHHHAFSGVTQQKRQAEKQQNHANAQHRVTAQQPIARTGKGTLDHVRTTGSDRLAHAWLSCPGIVGQGPTRW
ncbi:hypothetical protein D3C73_670920 [compost metagenome]